MNLEELVETFDFLGDWDAWQQLSQLGTGQPAPRKDPWSEALDQWWKAVSPAAPDPVQGFYNQLIEQGKAFIRTSESLRRNLTPQGGRTDAEGWASTIDASLGGLRDLFTQGSKDNRDALHQMFSFWELPVDTWQRCASVLCGFPGDALGAFKPVGDLGDLGDGTEMFQEQVERFLSAPGLGYTREHQEQHQTFMRVLLAYQTALQEYNEQFTKIAVNSVERFRTRLTEKGSEDEAISTLRGLYDLWVDVCEEVYAEQVFTDEYTEAHGKLINSLMEVKMNGRTMVDEAVGTFGLPTRREVDSIEQRLQELYREVRSRRFASEHHVAIAPAQAAAPAPRTVTPKKAASATTTVKKKAAAKKRRTTTRRAGK